LSATWQWGVSGGDLCNLTINTEAAAKYLNDELEKRTITASVLADYIKAAAEAVDIERSIKTTSTDVVSLRRRGPLSFCSLRLAVAALEFLEMARQFIKCLFCMLIQMAADLQFHFGNLRIGLPLRVPDPSFRCLHDTGANLRQM
jgi:hypothetical protein